MGNDNAHKLTRQYQDREMLMRYILDGAASEPTQPIDDVYFDILRNRAGSRVIK